MAPPVKTLAQLQRNLENTLVPDGGFSAEAIENFYVFLKEARLMDQGIRLLDPDRFYWLDPVYRITRSELFDEQGRFSRGIVFRKAAQMGASTWSVAFIVWLCIDESRPLSIGSYWPTKEELQNFISTRLDPMLEGSEQLSAIMRDSDFNNTQAKKIGRSTIYFRHVAGKSAMDAVPMDIVFCDEVRLWEGLYPGGAAAALERIVLRMGQSDIQLMILMSTTGIPEDYMEQRWFESNQTKYFTRCPSGCVTEVSPNSRTANRVVRGGEAHLCEGRVIAGVVLSDFTPTDIVERRGKRGTWVCPCCGSDIEDPQDGGYQACYPDSEGMFAIEFAQTLAKTKNSRPENILQRFLSAEDMKEFMNGVMAKPHLNAEGRPVKTEHWQLARERGERMGLEWGYGSGCFLGADFRHNQTHIVIGEPGPFADEETGLVFPFRLAHIEVFEGGEWPAHLDQLMVNFGVQQAVIDFLPDTNRTLAFAKRHEGRVLLSEYKSGDMMRLPENRKKSNKRAAPDGREEYKVLLDQVKSLSASLGAFASGQWVVPAGPLRQGFTDASNYTIGDFDVVEGMDGKGREGFMQHLMGLALRNIPRGTKTEHGERVKISGVETQEMYDAGGFDPHFAHAFNYMVMASRVDDGGAALLRPSQETIDRVTAQREGRPTAGGTNLAALGPGGMAGVRRAMRTCGTCARGPREGRAVCQWTGYDVGADEPACALPLGWRARP